MYAIEINAKLTDNHEIHLKLPDSVKDPEVKVIVLYQQAVAAPTDGKRQFGQFRGQIMVADDFDQPLPDSFWLGSEK